MSYVVTIVREPPLSAGEVREALSEQADLGVRSTDAASMVIGFNPDSGGVVENMVFSDGQIELTTPSNALLAEAQSLARRLHARVLGEEGEDLTGVPLPADAPGRSGGVWVVVLLLAAMLVWWLVV